MRTTKERFQKYSDKELEVLERLSKIEDFTRDYGEIVRITPAPDGNGYDRQVILKKNWKVEIQITESEGFLKYGDIRLDYISAFTHLVGSVFTLSNRVLPEQVDRFIESIEVKKWGKLVSCNAETLVYYIPDPVNLMWLFSVACLKGKADYFIHKYGLYINRKREEGWESCFVAVNNGDQELGKCGILY